MRRYRIPISEMAALSVYMASTTPGNRVPIRQNTMATVIMHTSVMP